MFTHVSRWSNVQSMSKLAERMCVMVEKLSCDVPPLVTLVNRRGKHERSCSKHVGSGSRGECYDFHLMCIAVQQVWENVERMSEIDNEWQKLP